MCQTDKPIKECQEALIDTIETLWELGTINPLRKESVAKVLTN